MQRWFFLGNQKNKIPPKIQRHKKMSVKESVPEIKLRPWLFSVSMSVISPNERVYLSGSIPELGEWNYKKAIPLDKETNTNIWSKTVMVPNNVDIEYRYAICFYCEEKNEITVQKWETNIQPRILKDSEINSVTDVFGLFGNETKVTTGWLTMQTLVQFQFINNPLKLKSRLNDRIMNIKVTPVKLSFNNDLHVEESLSDPVEVEMPVGVSVDVSTLDSNPEICYSKPQQQFGREYKPNDVMIINILAPNPENLAYLIDFYSYSTRASFDDPPCHVGYTYALPNMFKPSEGNLELPVTCNVKHRPLGTVNIQYLIVKPMKESLCDLKTSYAKLWNPTWTGLEVGHRGLGASFKCKEVPIRENTIASLKKAAASGADLLEFDVHLSKDLIPVIYHDYHVCISMKKKKEVDFSEMMEVPVKDLTLNQLQQLKLYHLTEGRSHETLFFDDDLDEHQPFPTLEDVMKNIDPHVGFNVELKWNMELSNGTHELTNPFDMNLYVDKILEVVLKHAGDRRIIFSCFNPDICTMVRLKQNKYPVMFLTVGISNKYEAYRDPRCLSIPAAVEHAVSSDILGIVVHTEDLLRDPTQVKLATNAGLVIFCWGDDNNDKQTILKLKEMGLHAVIYDKFDQYTSKEVKESIFLMEAREAQREIMRMRVAALSGVAIGGSAASSAEHLAGGPSSPMFLDLGVRQHIAVNSTVTSLESLASSIELRDDDSDKSLKRNRDIIAAVDKESQLKGQPNTFQGLFPGGDYSKNTPKRTRKTDQ